MDRERIRRTAQIVLAVIAVLAGVGAGFRYFTRGFLGPHLVVTPAAGSVGIRPILEPSHFGTSDEVTVYFCIAAVSEIGDCAELGKGPADKPIPSKPIPAVLPDETDVTPQTYVLRAGPDETGGYPVRGRFEVESFALGPAQAVSSIGDASVSSLRLGESKQIAAGAACRPPIWLRDGRLAIGTTVVDPETGVTVDFSKLQAAELVWSPGGDKVAILTADRKEIRLAGPDGEGAVTRDREARGLFSSLSWSPEGDKLAYIAENDPAVPNLGPGPPTVRILNAVNGDKTTAGPGVNVAWSPKQADVLAVDTGGEIQASTPEGGRRDLASGSRPSWSPDGRLLSVVRRNDADQRVGWIVGVNGGGEAPLAGEAVCAHSFSPSGTKLAIVQDRDGKQTLLVREVEGLSDGG